MYRLENNYKTCVRPVFTYTIEIRVANTKLREFQEQLKRKYFEVYWEKQDEIECSTKYQTGIHERVYSSIGNMREDAIGVINMICIYIFYIRYITMVTSD